MWKIKSLILQNNPEKSTKTSYPSDTILKATPKAA
jgi:hypothetical protein